MEGDRPAHDQRSNGTSGSIARLTIETALDTHSVLARAASLKASIPRLKHDSPGFGKKKSVMWGKLGSRSSRSKSVSPRTGTPLMMAAPSHSMTAEGTLDHFKAVLGCLHRRWARASASERSTAKRHARPRRRRKRMRRGASHAAQEPCSADEEKTQGIVNRQRHHSLSRGGGRDDECCRREKSAHRF